MPLLKLDLKPLDFRKEISSQVTEKKRAFDQEFLPTNRLYIQIFKGTRWKLQLDQGLTDKEYALLRKRKLETHLQRHYVPRMPTHSLTPLARYY